MVALLCIMGQLGSFVPADLARLALLDGVYTRMGAGDDLAAGMSTFLVELWNTSYILHKCSGRSLVILDELGRGTATYDGMALAEATVKHLVTRVGCPALFVTHYPQLSELALDPALRVSSGGKAPKVKAGHMAFIEPEAGGSDMTFLYRLKEEGAGRSYGLNVAKMAGMDAELLALVAVKSRELEARFERLTAATTASAAAAAAAAAVAAIEAPPMEEAESEEEEEEEEEEDGKAAAVLGEVKAAVAELKAVEESGELSLRDYNKKRREILGRVVAAQASARAAGLG
jgi:DNA mismatch repair ATPase MutS